ncbi:uncharacterized protein N7459_002090 [Penicillium hispanicum]|uniref:uncharacterized protein n=1 Tax=Penicillium hispanicum TaxID=1080232 RepID=UPI00253F99F7|nr:uncharacterized protein N7459_002090 [Penicillium hispanicum]KAJ5591721.1 hypothetical protein N7459_002090 [Penicillium hispanicum]
MKVSQLYVYPIKSLRPAEVTEGTLTTQGLLFDRRYMLLKVESGKDGAKPTLENMHIPHFPEMGLFQTAVELPKTHDGPGKIIVTYNPPSSQSEDDIKPRGTKRLQIPLRPFRLKDKKHFKKLKITMHQSPTIAYDMGARYNDWFSECLGFPVILAYLGLNSRKVLGTLAPAKRNKERWWSLSVWKQEWIGPMQKNWLFPLIVLYAVLIMVHQPFDWIIEHGWEPRNAFGVTALLIVVSFGYLHWRLLRQREERITFADCAPFLVVSETSVSNVSARLSEGEGMDCTKFRPNIVISGAETAFEEDFWTELAVGSERSRLLLTGNCVRCQSLNVDFETGKRATGESGTVLEKLMKDRRVDRGAKYSPVFGRYSFLDRAAIGKTIRVGDEVKVLARSKERTVTDWPGLTN